MRTSEAVTPMHPDKLCDRISDAILDECLRQDPMSRVAVETMGGHGIITVTGEITTTAFFDAREIVERIAPGNGVQVNIVKQSPEIAGGVDTGGAGDQGIMNGYACNECEAKIPLEHFLARDLCQDLYSIFPEDGKTQITLTQDGLIKSVVASFCNVVGSHLEIRCLDWLGKYNYVDDVEIFANPAGDWNQGGFEADTGLTGRKLAVDNYGTRIPLGGGAFSGKDATKVDRSAAYMARSLAVKYLEDNQECFCQLAYAIGVAEPVMATVTTTRKDGSTLQRKITGEDLKPNQIIEALGLRNPQFEKTAEWGHFGNNFAWDK
jgi:S-adenosylmethionine synthetase